MASEVDLSTVAAQANAHLWDSLIEDAFNYLVPTQEDTTKYAFEAVEMVLKVLGVENPRGADHVKVRIEDLDGKMTKVAIHYEAITEQGQTAIVALGYGEPEPGERN